MHRHAERVLTAVEKDQSRADAECGIEETYQRGENGRRVWSQKLVSPVRNPIITSPAPINASTTRTITSSGEATICSSTKYRNVALSLIRLRQTAHELQLEKIGSQVSGYIDYCSDRQRVIRTRH